MPVQKNPAPRQRVPRSQLPLLVLCVSVLSTGCDGDQDGDGWTVQQGDCDDAAPEVYPGAPELCNSMDDDCDGQIDADDPSLAPWYQDSDGDGHGNTTDSVQTCPVPAGYVATSGDCDDADPEIHPGALDVCDGLDNDCDLLADADDPDTIDYPSDGLDDDCDGHEAVFVQLSGGGHHTLALDDLGRVWSWGDNLVGQLGDGTYTDRLAPVEVIGAPNAVAVAAGLYHSLALGRNGTVWAWGDNYYGQLGVGSTVSGSATPVRVSGLTGVTAIASGSEHSLALLRDGTVNAWGESRTCGTSYNCYEPLPVTGLPGVKAISGGGSHSLALLQNGTVMAWGSNDRGQLGDGTTINRYPPVQVSGLTNVQNVATGGFHSLAVLDDGTVRAWGYNEQGQLGDGSRTNRALPIAVTGLTDVMNVAAGGAHSLGLLRNGSMRAWGYNKDGQLGDGTTTDRITPVQVVGLKDIVLINSGLSHSLALSADSRAWAWGNNVGGQLGDGTRTSRSTPVIVSAPGRGDDSAQKQRGVRGPPAPAGVRGRSP